MSAIQHEDSEDPVIRPKSKPRIVSEEEASAPEPEEEQVPQVERFRPRRATLPPAEVTARQNRRKRQRQSRRRNRP